MFQLEGKLAGPWVRELEVCWQRMLAAHNRPIVRMDLTGVTFVDAVGRKFLALLHAQGVEFVSAGCLMNAIVAEITGAPPHGRGCRWTENGPFK